MRTVFGLFAVLILVFAWPLQPAYSQGKAPRLIRDAEVENIIRQYATPIFNAAGLSGDSVSIHLVRDDQLNAFVAGGQRLFIHTGLLIRADHPGQVIGVIAHEAGHIAGGHLARLQSELENAEITSIVTMILGAAIGVATGDGRAAGAIGAGGQQATLSSLLKYSRTQESAADAAGLSYLDRTGQSAKGMLEFLKILQTDIRLQGGREHPYMSSHPLTADRINTVANHIALSRYSDAPIPQSLRNAQEMMRAKLVGFLYPYETVLRLYPEENSIPPAVYARAIAHYQRADLGKALPLIDSLIALQPRNPYFEELKGQMLFENGRIADSIVPYQRSVDLAPDEPLLRVNLGRAQVESGNDALLQQAREHLHAAASAEPRMRDLWRLLTIVYGRLGERGAMSLAQAEYALLGGDLPAARSLADRAVEQLPTGSPGWLRAQDIAGEARRRIDRK